MLILLRTHLSSPHCFWFCNLSQAPANIWKQGTKNDVGMTTLQKSYLRFRIYIDTNPRNICRNRGNQYGTIIGRNKLWSDMTADWDVLSKERFYSSCCSWREVKKGSKPLWNKSKKCIWNLKEVENSSNLIRPNLLMGSLNRYLHLTLQFVVPNTWTK